MSLAATIRPKVIVICGPSGTGKSTLLTKLFHHHPTRFGFSISHTTRQPRTGEVDGVAYNFVTREAFLKLVQDNKFIEHAEFSGNFYGTSEGAVQAVVKGEKTCILDIDTQGVKLIKAHHAHLAPLYVFISPPSLSDLKTRLSGRGTESDASLQARLAAAVGEVEYAKTGEFDLVVVNDEVERAYKVLEGICVDGSRDGDKLPEF